MKKVLSLVLVLAVCLTLSACKSDDYESAVASMEAGHYEEAIVAFTELGDYKDSLQKLEECQTALSYESACTMLANKKYEEALTTFTELGDYKDSANKVRKCEATIALSSSYDNVDDLISALLKYFKGTDEDIEVLSNNIGVHYAFQEENDGLAMYHKLSGKLNDAAIYKIFDACNTSNWFWGIDAGGEPLGFSGDSCQFPSIRDVIDDIKGKFWDPESVSITVARAAIVSKVEDGMYEMPLKYVVIADIRATNAFGGTVQDQYQMIGYINKGIQSISKGGSLMLNYIYYGGEEYTGTFLQY